VDDEVAGENDKDGSEECLFEVDDAVSKTAVGRWRLEGPAIWSLW